MSLRDGEFRYRGHTFGYAPVVVTEVEGLIGSEARVGDRDMPRGDGAVPGDHYLAPKTPILTAVVTSRAALGPLRAALRSSRTVELPLSFGLDGEQLRVWCRVVGLEVQHRPGSVHVQIALRASDPRVYAEEQRSVSVPVYVVGGAGGAGYHDYPGDYPKDATTVGGAEAVAHNAGDSDAHPLLRVWGPTSGLTSRVTVTNRTNGSVLDVATDVGAGQILTCRMREYVTGRTDERIIEVSGADRYGAWQSRPAPLRLSPGDNVIRLTEEGAAPSGAALTWQDTWDGSEGI